MRSSIVMASLASLLMLAQGAGAAEQITGGAHKLANQNAKPSAAAADVPTTEITSTVTHAPEVTGATGLRSTGAEPRIARTTTREPQQRLSGVTRTLPTRNPNGLTGSTPRAAATADVPLSIVKSTISRAPRAAAGVKKLATPGGRSLQATGDKFSSKSNSKIQH
jgi:hypothetical protein